MGGDGQDAALGEQSLAVAPRCARASELSASGGRHAVVPGQPGVDEREVRDEKLVCGAVELQKLRENPLGFLAHGPAERGIEHGEHGGVHLVLGQLTRAQPLPGKVGSQSRRLGVTEHPLQLFRHLGIVVEQAIFSRRHELRVGHRAPQAVAQPTGQLEVIHPMGLDGAGLGVDLHAEQKAGRHQEGLQGEANPFRGGSILAERDVEETKVAGKLFLSGGPPPREAGKSLDDLPGARVAGGGAGGAGEHGAPAGIVRAQRHELIDQLAGASLVDLDVQRGDALCCGHRVEAPLDVVGRKLIARPQAGAEEVAQGIAVLRAVETPQGHSTRIGRLRRLGAGSGSGRAAATGFGPATGRFETSQARNRPC